MTSDDAFAPDAGPGAPLVDARSPDALAAKTPAGAFAADALADALAAVRAQIDAVDHELANVLARREVLVRRAGELKRSAAEVRAPARVDAVVNGARARAEALGASPDVAEATYRAMVGAFITLELSTSPATRGTAEPSAPTTVAPARPTA